jgi:hypothetical protein
MVWTQLDDGIYDHPKMLRAGEDATNLYVRSVVWCNKHLTDGAIPKEALRVLTSKPGVGKLAERLVESGLWEPTETGWFVHDFSDHNPTRAQVEARRAEVSAKRAEAGKRGGLRSGEVRRNEASCFKIASGLLEANGKQTGSKREAPSHPIPSQLTGDSDARAPAAETTPVAPPPTVSCSTVEPGTAHPEAAEVLAALSLRATGDHELELHHVLRDVAARGQGVTLAAARRLAAHLAAHMRPGSDGKAWRPTLHHMRGKDGRWTLFLSLLSESETCGRCDVESGQKAPQNARKRHHALIALETAPTPSPEEEAQRRASLAALRQSINNGASK